jgi:iron complex transport system substrate-binding protein
MRYVLAAVLLTAALVGCGDRVAQTSAAPVAGSGTLPVTVTGTDGRVVTVTDTTRIVSLAGGITETLFALGLSQSVVGRDISSDFPGTQDIPVVTEAHDVSPEAVLSLMPSLVLADARTGPPETLEAIRNAGVPVVIVPEVWSLEEIRSRVEVIAQAVAHPERASQVIEESSSKPPRVKGSPVVAFLYLRGNAAVYLLGGDGSGADSLLEAVGAVDAGSKAGLEAFTPLTPEALVALEPDALLVMQKGLESVGGIDGLLGLPGVEQTPAARDRRVIVVPDGELLNFGPRTPQTLAQIAEQLDT